MDFLSSKNTEFFDALEEILEDERFGQQSGYINSLHLNFSSSFRPFFSGKESKSPYRAEHIPIM